MNGLRIYIKGGVGSGQYGYIWNYDPASKVAMIYRESDSQPGWDNIVPGKVSATVLNATTNSKSHGKIQNFGILSILVKLVVNHHQHHQ